MFDFFQILLEKTQIFIGTPLVKKYNNCIFFGEGEQGILYYFTDRVYYGGFVNGQKNGPGIDIELCRENEIGEEFFGNYKGNRVFDGTFV